MHGALESEMGIRAVSKEREKHMIACEKKSSLLDEWIYLSKGFVHFE